MLKRSTHWVTCRETEPAYGPGYQVLAVKDKNGQWRMAERRIAKVPYGTALTGVTVHGLRAPARSKRTGK